MAVVAVVEHVVVSPAAEDVVATALVAVRDRRPWVVELATVDVDRPWSRRQLVSVRVRQLMVLQDGWITINGEPAGEAEWSSISVLIWHGEGAPVPFVSVEDQLLGVTPPPVFPEPRPATASLVTA